MKFSDKFKLPFLVLITAGSRIPFILDGYGVEEDSWGLVVNAYQMKQQGHYLASRFPGHPLQEYVYRFIYDQPAWVYNSFSVLVSVIAVAFFFLSLRKMQLPNSFLATLAFSLSPCFFISGTYTIDFAWSLAFVMASMYYLFNSKFLLSGILIGLAIGCRITSGVFIIPWAILLFSKMDIQLWLKRIFMITIPAVIIGILFYIPACRVYGMSFFDYSDQFAYPPMTKVLYKASIGVFGLLGILAIAIYFLPALLNLKKKSVNAVTLFSSQKLLFACITTIILLAISYLRLPQKSGYLIPVVPFLVIIFALLLREKQFRILSGMMMFSPFLFSVNLTDDLRGAAHSSAAITFHVSGQEIFIDPFSGPVFSERSKRINKLKFVNDIIAAEHNFDFRYMVISGWWYNELQVERIHHNKSWSRHYSFYMTCPQMDSAHAQQTEIFYLPEQDRFNDEMFGQTCTDSLAHPFPSR